MSRQVSGGRAGAGRASGGRAGRGSAGGLPEAFVENLRRWFPPAQAERILAGLRSVRPTTLRVNTLKADVRAVLAELREANVKVERVAWYPEALVCKNAGESELEQLAGYREGRFYLQSLSSMLPPLALEPCPGERVLDMAAAPGSKTTQMAAMMRNQGYILANDASAVRAERLRFNLNRQGVVIAEVSVQDGRRLGSAFSGRFDRVLLDAPCSGEGRFVAGRPATYRHWSERLVARMVQLQRRLLLSALRAVRPGGIVVYSTCTINPEENEGVVDWVLRRFGAAIEVQPVGLAVPGGWSGLTRASGPQGAERLYHPDLRHALRVPPSATMEGFFVCRLRVVAALPR